MTISLNSSRLGIEKAHRYMTISEKLGTATKNSVNVYENKEH